LKPESQGENPIWSLEKLKDQIIAAFNTHTELDEGTRRIWYGDTKEMYYSMVLADQMISRAADADSCRARLSIASSRFEQVRSELRSLEEKRLEEDLSRTFHVCHERLSARVPAIPPASDPPARVTRPSPGHYELPCSFCGKIAVRVNPAPPQEKILEGVICAGISRAVGLKVDDEGKIFGWLDCEDLAALHKYMDDDCDIDGGLDAYCPNCDRIYCRTHYNVREVWDEGFYDCSKATCPQGHTREIDD
jgi:hypothetical protein